MMMMNNCSSHRSCDHNNYKQQQKNDSKEWSLANDDQKKNIDSSISRRMFKCDLCHRIFTSGTALGGHKSHHYRSVQPVAKKHKHDVLDDHRKHHYNNVFSSNKGFKGIEWQNTSSFLEQQSNMCDDDQFQLGTASPTIDLSKYLPPRSYKTKKRSSIKRGRNMIDHETLNAASILIHMSRGRAVGGDHGHTPKRLKISSNAYNDYIEKQASGCDIEETPETKGKDNNIKKSLVLRFKIPKSSSKDNKILQTSEDCRQHGSIDIEEKKKNNEVGGETEREQSHNELKSKRVVRNFDLNELPNDVADE